MNESARNIEKTRWAKIADAWLAVQLAHYGGKYSVERMLGLEEYSRNTSVLRVLFVSTCLPLLVFGLVLCQESIPLQNPSDGWKENYGFWIRVGILGAATGFALACHIGPWLDVPRLSLKQTFVYCLLMGIGLVTVGMAAAKVLVFPIPFFVFSMSLVLGAMLVGFLRFVVGSLAFQQILSRREQLRQLNKMGSLQNIMCAAYAVYQVLFTKANITSYKLAGLLFLPVFKFIMKMGFVYLASHKEDILPQYVLLNVEFFNAFYLATFMQSMSSSTLAAVLVIGLVQTTMGLRELHLRTQIILTRLQGAADIVCKGTESNANVNLLSAVRSLCCTSKTLHSQMHPDIRVHACISQQLSREGRALLDTLSIYSQVHHSNGSVQPSTNLIRVLPRSNSASFQYPHSYVGKFSRILRGSVVQPSNPVSIAPQHRATHDFSSMKRKKSMMNNASILHEALEVLFTSECIVLAGYVEIVIPVCYAIFVIVMVHLPSAQYHAEMVGVNQENVGSMVSRIFIYALVELLSFIILAVTANRNCGINTFHQLGFVMETQMPLILSNLLLWMLYTLTFRVTHFGADFSFQF